MRENIIKIYWQAMNGDGRESIFTQHPLLDGATYELVDECRSYKNLIYTFPITLKPLQIAKITVNENGTWSYEIEREEGWYMAKWSDKIDTAPDRKNIFIEYKCGKYLFPSGKEISDSDFAELTISSTRIPDECII